MRSMPLPESFDRVAVIDATLKDLLAARLVDFDTLSEGRKFTLRNDLMPMVNAMAPHIHAQLEAKRGQEALSEFVIPDTLEGFTL
jgi:hypothetical protein